DFLVQLGVRPAAPEKLGPKVARVDVEGRGPDPNPDRQPAIQEEDGQGADKVGHIWIREEEAEDVHLQLPCSLGLPRASEECPDYSNPPVRAVACRPATRVC